MRPKNKERLWFLVMFAGAVCGLVASAIAIRSGEPWVGTGYIPPEYIVTLIVSWGIMFVGFGKLWRIRTK